MNNPKVNDQFRSIRKRIHWRKLCLQKICIKLQDFIDTSMICSSHVDNYEKEPKRNYDVLVSQGFENISYVLLFNISIHISRKTANSEPGFETRIHSFASKMTVQNRLQSHHTLHTRQKLFAATIVNCVFEKQTLCIIFWMAHNPLCLFKWIVYLPRKLNQPRFFFMAQIQVQTCTLLGNFVLQRRNQLSILGVP